ncbi:hypothetical protein CEUSTIGMA_g6510.t1 [Chlamydomonas eustigma]|uniref:Uncharacterized protein n=1 Tax=Chlamydomonas eustigma TaxID=1157962 RepID=A0A250X8H5_9CHLO|nr:hypothetical protein CEUSTIGMA_g6510.t1 [Chlamydomonas eustigma]|eukprot:GAX79070.1 hypothetical protein CEUSTIGMA_g6510.t1 [Chlamydomonas eustigma]
MVIVSRLKMSRNRKSLDLLANEMGSRAMYTVQFKQVLEKSAAGTVEEGTVVALPTPTSLLIQARDDLMSRKNAAGLEILSKSKQNAVASQRESRSNVAVLYSKAKKTQKATSRKDMQDEDYHRDLLRWKKEFENDDDAMIDDILQEMKVKETKTLIPPLIKTGKVPLPRTNSRRNKSSTTALHVNLFATASKALAPAGRIQQAGLPHSANPSTPNEQAIQNGLTSDSESEDGVATDRSVTANCDIKTILEAPFSSVPGNVAASASADTADVVQEKFLQVLKKGGDTNETARSLSDASIPSVDNSAAAEGYTMNMAASWPSEQAPATAESKPGINVVGGTSKVPVEYGAVQHSFYSDTPFKEVASKPMSLGLSRAEHQMTKFRSMRYADISGFIPSTLPPPTPDIPPSPIRHSQSRGGATSPTPSRAPSPSPLSRRSIRPHPTVPPLASSVSACANPMLSLFISEAQANKRAQEGLKKYMEEQGMEEYKRDQEIEEAISHASKVAGRPTTSTTGLFQRIDSTFIPAPLSLLERRSRALSSEPALEEEQEEDGEDTHVNTQRWHTSEPLPLIAVRMSPREGVPHSLMAGSGVSPISSPLRGKLVAPGSPIGAPTPLFGSPSTRKMSLPLYMLGGEGGGMVRTGTFLRGSMALAEEKQNFYDSSQLLIKAAQYESAGFIKLSTVRSVDTEEEGSCLIPSPPYGSPSSYSGRHPASPSARHGSQLSMRHGSQLSMCHGTQLSMRHGTQLSMRHGAEQYSNKGQGAPVDVSLPRFGSPSVRFGYGGPELHNDKSILSRGSALSSHQEAVGTVGGYTTSQIRPSTHEASNRLEASSSHHDHAAGHLGARPSTSMSSPLHSRPSRPNSNSAIPGMGGGNGIGRPSSVMRLKGGVFVNVHDQQSSTVQHPGGRHK